MKSFEIVLSTLLSLVLWGCGIATEASNPIQTPSSPTREQIPPARTDKPLTPAQADALMAHLVKAINQENRAAIEPYLLDNRRTEEFFKAAIADYKTHFKGEPISHFELEEFKNEGLWQQKPIQKFSYRVYSKSGINKQISINQELGNVRMIDLCFFYSYPAKM